jgi:hemerythrin-like domain-containing protein
MLRDKNLVPLSRQHQHALALCVRIDRASPIAEANVTAWQDEIAQHFEAEISIHFAAEEQVLFPAARKFSELLPLVEELISDHAWLRECFAAAKNQTLSGSEIRAFATRLSTHIRKEERRLFEQMQKLLGKEEFARIGSELEKILIEADQTCILPNETTRLKTAK